MGSGDVRPTRTIDRLGCPGSDVQMLVDLMTDADLSRCLLEGRGTCSQSGIRNEEQPLRPFDVLIWTKTPGAMRVLDRTPGGQS